MTKIKLNTVNVLRIVDKQNMGIDLLASFTDNKKGNKAAEKLFADLVREEAVKDDYLIDSDDSEEIERLLDTESN